MDNQADRDVFYGCLREVLRFTERQARAVIDDGYEVAEDIAFWSYDEITEWVAHKEKIKTGNQRIHFGDLKKKSLTGLAWWVTERVRTGDPVNLQLFDEDARRQSIVEAKVERDNSKEESQATKPQKFKYEEWTEWEKSVYTYLLAEKNPMGIPLAYVVRKDSLKSDVDDRTWKIISNASLDGAVFRSDTAKVLTLLKSLTNGTDAENWMKGKSCGRDAMMALQAHYDGEAESEKRKEAARSDLKALFYRNEASFSFEKYLNRMKRCFDTLEKYSVPYYEEEKVKLLLDRIQSSHAEVKTQVSICRANYAGDFVQASTYMSREISRIFPSSNVSSLAFGKGPKSRGGSRNVSTTGSGRRKGKRGNNKMNNGVDISDPTRYFSKAEWRKLDDDVRSKILADPERAKKKKAKTERSISSVTSDSQSIIIDMPKETEERIVAAVMKASREQGDGTSTVLKNATGPRHGSRVPSSIGSVVSRSSAVTFDRSVNN